MLRAISLELCKTQFSPFTTISRHAHWHSAGRHATVPLSCFASMGNHLVTRLAQRVRTPRVTVRAAQNAILAFYHPRAASALAQRRTSRDCSSGLRSNHGEPPGDEIGSASAHAARGCQDCVKCDSHRLWVLCDTHKIQRGSMLASRRLASRRLAWHVPPSSRAASGVAARPFSGWG